MSVTLSQGNPLHCVLYWRLPAAYSKGHKAHAGCKAVCCCGRMPIFLFNYNDRLMHGIFRATSEGELEINPHGEPAADQHLMRDATGDLPRFTSCVFANSRPCPAAWTGTEHLKTRFPAQVRVERSKTCQPIHERYAPGRQLVLDKLILSVCHTPMQTFIIIIVMLEQSN